MNKSTQGALDQLPFQDGYFDWILMCHSLELEGDPEAILEEVYRVLKLGGRLVIIAPNRHRFLSRSEYFPFGSGTPYTKSQLKQLLRVAKFSAESWSGVGLLSPANFGDQSRFIKYQGPISSGFLKPFSGVIIMEAEKKVFSGVKTNAKEGHGFKTQPAPI